MDLQLLAIIVLITNALIHSFLFARKIFTGAIFFVPMYLLIAGLIFWGSRSVFYLGIVIPLIDAINLLFTNRQFPRHKGLAYSIILLNIVVIIVCRWLFFVRGTPLRFQFFL